jgi:hypothetical protein
MRKWVFSSTLVHPFRESLRGESGLTLFWSLKQPRAIRDDSERPLRVDYNKNVATMDGIEIFVVLLILAGRCQCCDELERRKGCRLIPESGPLSPERRMILKK